MKIKPIIKNNAKVNLSSWILEKFPENYCEMNYLEPFFSDGLLLLNKLKSKEEVISNSNKEIVDIWRMIKDDYKLFKISLKKLKYSEKFFNEIKAKKEKNSFKITFLNFVLMKMTKNENKEIVQPLERKKSNKFWLDLEFELDIVNSRLQEVYILNKSSIELIKYFNDSNTFCFCDMSNNNDLDAIDHIKSYRGKIAVLTENISTYRRNFLSWKCNKSKNKKYCLWINY